MEPLRLGESGADYLGALRFKGLDTDVRYFDPTRPAPPLETNAAPEPVERLKSDEFHLSLDGSERIAAIVLLAVLLLIILLSLGRIGTAVSFRRETKDAARASEASTDGNLAEERLPDLDAILRLADRREALVRLAQLALTRCLNAQGVLFQRSWTQREALRKLPVGQPHLNELKALVLDSERVNFGHRSVGDGELEGHVDRMRPLLRGLNR